MDDFLKIILSIFLMCSTTVTIIIIYLFCKALKGIGRVKNSIKRMTVVDAIDHTKLVSKTVIRIIKKK